jgi:hypothetical protein
MAQYIDKNALVAEIDRQKIGYNVDGKHSVEYDITRKIIDIINSLEVKEVKEEPVSEDLEEAAWQYYDRNKPPMPPELDFHKELVDFFKAGVRWKEQNNSNLSEVLVRDNFDKMAEEYSSCTYLEEVLGEGDREVLKARLKNTFKAGAKWQKEQMMKDVVYGLVCGHDESSPAWIDLNLLNKPNVKVGTEVKLIIIEDDIL